VNQRHVVSAEPQQGQYGNVIAISATGTSKPTRCCSLNHRATKGLTVRQLTISKYDGSRQLRAGDSGLRAFKPGDPPRSRQLRRQRPQTSSTAPR
jgi:hypothetical protein